MVRKIGAIVPSFVLVFMLVCGPLMADAHPASAGEHRAIHMGTASNGDCHHDEETKGRGEPSVPAGHHDASSSACCSIICNGYAMTAPSFTPELFVVAVATINDLQFLPTNQSVLFYHPPKA